MGAPRKRYLHDAVAADLRRKMVFVGGARQVGKTHLGRTLIPAPKAHLNWDVGEHREAILRRELPPARELFFDEIHKYRGWRGFPEPFLGGSAREARRWSREYRERLVREEVTGLETVQDLGRLELLALRLPELVGSPLSVNALREDLHTSHRAVSRWLDVFERLYAIFRLPTFGAPRIRAVKKERKHYHSDWSCVANDAARFENLVASNLLKWVHFQVDTEGRDLELLYFRDVDGREVDFVVVERRNPVLMVECKWGDAPVAPGLRYLKERFARCEAWQVSATGAKDFETPEGIRTAPAPVLLARLV